MPSWWFPRVTPSTQTNPAVGYEAFFAADGTESTIAGALYRKDPDGTVTLVGGGGGSGGGGGEGGETRAVANATTTSLAPNALTTGTPIVLAVGYRLLSISTTRPARVRLYISPDLRDADEVRAIGVDPDPASGVTLDYVTSTGDYEPLNPLVDGVSLELPPTATIPMTVTNLDTTTGTVGVSIGYLRTEA